MVQTFLHIFILSCNLGSTAAPFPILPRHIFMSAPAAPPKMRPAVPVSVSGAPVPVTVSSGVPMQVVSKSAAYPAGAPITYYRPPGSGVPGPGVTYPAGYVGSGPTAVPQGRVIQSVTTPVGQAPGRIVRTSQATPLPLSKSPPMSQPTRPNTVGGPAYSQSAYETKHEKDEQLQNLKLGKFSFVAFVEMGGSGLFALLRGFLTFFGDTFRYSPEYSSYFWVKRRCMAPP